MSVRVVILLLVRAVWSVPNCHTMSSGSPTLGTSITLGIYKGLGERPLVLKYCPEVSAIGAQL